MLDLACGTGTLAILMARRSWKVLAIDASQGMLEKGIEKARDCRTSVEFKQADMRSFVLPHKVSLVTCMFDAVNHLTSQSDVRRCFRRVRKALEPGGYFIFDVNNEECYQTVWRQTEVTHERNFSIILENRFDSGSREAECRVTLYLQKGSVFEKRKEKVRERYYAQEEIKKLLADVGFQVLGSDDFNFTRNPMVGRLKTWWVARITG